MSEAKDIMYHLLAEVSPSDTIIYKNMSGVTRTAAQMAEEVRNGTELGQKYATDVLRVARDLLAREASRQEPAAPEQEVWGDGTKCPCCGANDDQRRIKVVEYCFQDDTNPVQMSCGRCGKPYYIRA